MDKKHLKENQNQIKKSLTRFWPKLSFIPIFTGYEMGTLVRNGLIFETKYSRMNQVFKNGPFKLFKGCLPQILLSPFLNTLSHLFCVKNETLYDEAVTYETLWW